MAILKQSTAYTRLFVMVLSSDHITGATGTSPIVTLSKAGAAVATAGGTVAEVTGGLGQYKISLTTADTSALGDLAFHVTATSCDPTDFIDQVTAQILGDTLTANATQLGGQTVTATAGISFAGGFVASTGGSVTTITGNVNGSVASVVAAVTIATGSKVDVDTIKTNPVVNAGTVTFPTNSTLASTTNITGGTVTTVSGNVNGSVASVVAAVTIATGSKVDVDTIKTNPVVNAGTVTFPTNATLASTTNITAGTIGTVSGNVNGSVGSVGSAVAITANIKQNTTSAGFMFVMTDSTNHVPATGLVVTATRSIDGTAFGACANAVSEVGNGTYVITLDATDVNGKHIMLRFTAPSADDLNIEIITQP